MVPIRAGDHRPQGRLLSLISEKMKVPHFTPVPLMALSLALVFSLGRAQPAQTVSDSPSSDNGSDLVRLRATHPRLIADAATWENLRARRATDLQLAALLTAIEGEARSILTQPPAEHRKIGRRLLDVSRLVQRRTLTLAVAYRVTGDTAFLRRAEDEMLAAAAFADWNPSHFLDVAEMTAALALGYDWLHGDLPPEARRTIRTAIVEKGLRPALDAIASPNGWPTTENNWNQVCFGGAVLGALAVGDEEPGIAGKILTQARTHTVHGMRAYAPDGIYPEGPSYWSFGISYSVLTIAALQSALGTDWQLAESAGFLASAGVFLQLTAPSGRFFNFSDCAEPGSIEPALFWFARRLGNPGLVTAQLEALKPLIGKTSVDGFPGESGRLLPLAAIWWPDRTADTAPALPLRWHGRGSNPVAVFRSSWTDPNAFYLGLKGGAANLSHAHMDAGSFVFECDGVRWARDLGRQDYESLESKGVDLWNRHQDSQRWQVFRLNNRSHNTLTIDGQLHRVDGEARIAAFSDADENPYAIVDLTPVFAGQAGCVRRGFRVRHEREVLVQDELAGLKPGSDVRWAMATGAEVAIEDDGARAILSEHRRQLMVRLLAPTSARFEVIAADPPDDGFNASNPGRRLLVVHAVAPADGTLTLAVWLNSGNAAASAAPMIEPLDRWLGGGSPQ
jgi:hypothetical protein